MDSMDPHNPQTLGLNRVLWGGVFLYVKATHNRETIERYGRGTPDDWVERNIYSKFRILGVTLMGVADVILFGSDRVDSVLGGRRDQRGRPLLGLSQLVHPRRQHQHRAVGYHHWR